MTGSEMYVLELGEAVAVGLRAENYGLVSQRANAIKCRRLSASGWVIERDANGTPVRMRWCG